MPVPSPPAPGASPQPATAARALRRRGVANLLRMGHCAPAVMQTLIGRAPGDGARLVRLCAGLPGGIGNTGGECGGVTAPLVLLGLRHGLETGADGVPIVVSRGRELLRRFEAIEGTASCRDIRGGARVPWRCIGVVGRAPVLCAQVMRDDRCDALSACQRQACARLHAHWTSRDFHCARSVFRHLGAAVGSDATVLAAVSAFMGGTVLSGRTCSALTAGVMALGLAQGEIEDSPVRVARMIATMSVGGDAFADHVNAFNRTMNRGHRLARWFEASFGSLECRTITGCDVSMPDGADRYRDGDLSTRCEGIVRAVARQVAGMIGPGAPG